MDKDRVIGAAKVVEGKAKVAVGKIVGDAKLVAEGEAEKVEGKIQNAAAAARQTKEPGSDLTPALAAPSTIRRGCFSVEIPGQFRVKTNARPPGRVAN